MPNISLKFGLNQLSLFYYMQKDLYVMALKDKTFHLQSDIIQARTDCVSFYVMCKMTLGWLKFISTITNIPVVTLKQYV